MNFYGFLKQDALQPLELNADTIPGLSLVNIPSLSKVRLMYGVGFRLRIIGTMPSTIANQYGMHSGEVGPDLGCANVLTLPSSIYQPANIAKIKIKEFITKVTAKVTAYNYPLLIRSNFSDTTKLLQIDPIPTFLIYDGFEKDLDAAEVLERVLFMDRNRGGQKMTLNLQQFLLFFISIHNAKHPKPYVNSEIMMRQAHSSEL